jgi:site-specific DNA-methyltransferase (adenine-specific)
VDLIFLDPPFNLGKNYGATDGESDKMDAAGYRNFMIEVLDESIRILRDGGALYLYHIPSWAFQFAAHLNSVLQFRHWIAISMKNGFARGEYLYPAHYALLYFTKGSPAVFTRPKIPTPRCRHCDGYIKDYGGYAKYVEEGINLADVWEDLSPVRHRRYKNREANELPSLLPRRVLQISGKSGGVFVDPFAGSGTSLLEARAAGMSFIAGDLEDHYCELAWDRLRSSEPRNSK